MGIYFSDPVWDKKLSEGQTVPDLKKRTAIYEEIQKMWADDVMTAPIFQGTLFIFTLPNVNGVNLSPTLRFNYDPLYKD